MRQQDLTGKAQTVLGIVDADSLGITLPHEHLLIDESVYYVEPIEASEIGMAHGPIAMETLYWLKTHLVNQRAALYRTDPELAIKEALIYKRLGGGTIVDLTNNGLGRDPLGLAYISRATGLNIIMGSGYYLGSSHPLELATKTEEEIAEEIVRDITVGVGDTGVRAGIIGEIGCETPLAESEKKVLRAAAIAQKRTGAPLNVHPSMTRDLLLEIIKILNDAGADLTRTIISHTDLWAYSQDTRREIAQAGCYVEFDSFGHEEILSLYGQFIETPSDIQKVSQLAELIEDGYLEQLLISQDIDCNHNLVTYGGYGFGHIVRDMISVMHSKGISDEQIHTLLVENPKRVLSFAPLKV
ncbi:MAG: hypothetical protein PHI12_09535 [Dehalococcoidales bacterium]|nr:hypothetical protein [Dehalococcoidales bacterium]